MSRGDQAPQCCAPTASAAPTSTPIRSSAGSSAPRKSIDRSSGGPRFDRRVEIDKATYVMGSGAGNPMAYPGDGETHAHDVALDAFSIDQFAVTNLRFAEFVSATGHVTEAERIGWSFVFGGLLPDDFEETRGVVGAPWWRQVFGAAWHSPKGAHSSAHERLDHPVVHVSHDDAIAFCDWDNGRLPTEAEWELAARGGLAGAIFPWGDELEPEGKHRMNVWQGLFPAENSEGDGWYGTAPVDAYDPNGHGLHNMTGNVWEWCADWFAADWYRQSPRANPQGPASGDSRVMRGGSYLCHASYCHRYRVAARSGNTPMSTAGNIGFRTVGLPG